MTIRCAGSLHQLFFCSKKIGAEECSAPTTKARLPRLQWNARRLSLRRHLWPDRSRSRYDHISRGRSTAWITRQPRRVARQSWCGPRQARRGTWKSRRRSRQSGLSPRQPWSVARQTRRSHWNLRRHARRGRRSPRQRRNFARQIGARRNGVGESWKSIGQSAEPVCQWSKAICESRCDVAACKNICPAQIGGRKWICSRERAWGEERRVRILLRSGWQSCQNTCTREHAQYQSRFHRKSSALLVPTGTAAGHAQITRNIVVFCRGLQ